MSFLSVLADDRNAFDFEFQGLRQAVRDRRPGGKRGLKGLAIKLIVAPQIGWIADIVTGLHHLPQRASRRLQDAPHVRHRAAKLPLEGIGDNFPGVVHGGLTGDEEKVSDAHHRTEGKVRLRHFFIKRIFDHRKVLS
jgi:hypothetical protein